MLASLERYQVIVYLVAIAAGLAAGSAFAIPPIVELAPWPLLAALLYVTFLQVPLTRLSGVMKDRGFFAAALLGNFVCLPLLVAALLWWAPDQPALRLGIALVLLVPCTDWFITFSQLGGGDTRHAIAFAPLSLLCQLALLPLYLWWLVDGGAALGPVAADMLTAFATVILAPLGLAWLTQRWAMEGAATVAVARSGRARWLERSAWLPVPLLGLVVGIIAMTQVGSVLDALAALPRLALIFVAFLLGAALLARGLAKAFRLPVGQGRVLAFSLGTRNSFLVLPLALALPAGFEIAVVAIVFQSLIELLGMAFYLWWIPRRLFPGEATPGEPASGARR